MKKNDQYYMIQMSLDTDKLYRLAKERNLPLLDAEVGYLVHCTVKELFGDSAPKPFALNPNSQENKLKLRDLPVLGFSDKSATELEEIAKSFSEPKVYSICKWEDLASKPMPTMWKEGQRLDFSLRSVPVVRKSKDGIKHKKGAEVDVFLSKCWEVGDPERIVDRAAVYREWLAEKFERSEGALLLQSRLSSFRREKLLRRTHGGTRKAKCVERPSALFEGTLKVKDSEAFSNMVRNGIGRHKAFGFGMLLLRPAKG